MLLSAAQPSYAGIINIEFDVNTDAFFSSRSTPRLSPGAVFLLFST